jgi:hypothetical protein
MVFFIPWRVVAEESGAAHYGFGGAMPLDPLGPGSDCRKPLGTFVDVIALANWRAI